MIIVFSPQRSDAELNTLSVDGDVLTINGEDFDFSALGEGDTLPIGTVASTFITGEVTRSSGQVAVSVVLPCGPDASSGRRFPSSVIVTSGQVEIPE